MSSLKGGNQNDAVHKRPVKGLGAYGVTRPHTNLSTRIPAGIRSYNIDLALGHPVDKHLGSTILRCHRYHYWNTKVNGRKGRSREQY
jgi:hypothetical protein